MVLQCAAKGVSVYSPHTSCDNCQDGGMSRSPLFRLSPLPPLLPTDDDRVLSIVNDWLLKGFGDAGSTAVYVPTEKPPPGRGWNTLRVLSLPQYEAVTLTTTHSNGAWRWS